MESKISRILRNWRIQLVLVALVVSLLLVCNIIPVNKYRGGEPVGIGFGNGIDYGLDLGGGTQIQLRLEDPPNGTFSKDILEVERNILERRLNSMGLRDIKVNSWGDRYIVIRVASASPEELEAIENILKQQARFEARVDGEQAILGSEVSLDLSPRGSGLSGGRTYEWYVSIKLSRDGGERFCRVAEGKIGKSIDMFLDRPENSIIVMNNATYLILKENKEMMDDLEADDYIKIIVDRAKIPVVVIDGDRFDESILRNYSSYRRVIIAADESQISEAVRNKLEELNFTTVRKPRGGMEYSDWVNEIIGLKSSPRLRCDPCTLCKYSAQISGGAATFEEAEAELDEMRILIGSGNLPAEAVVESKSQFPASVGSKFLEYSFIIGVLSMFVVASIIYLRYRVLYIALPTIFVGISEIIITLGVASLIDWQLDLPAIAGIIAAVGTGVNDQIILNDETLKRRKVEEKKTLNVFEQIRRAFFIIFTAAFTILAVMIPLIMFVQALVGFAVTTIIGVFIGIALTRPAYGKFIEEMLKD